MPAVPHPAGAGVAIVTGGSRGIGAACCRLLAGRGFAVVVNYVGNKPAAEAVVAAIAAAGGRAIAAQADVAREADVLALFAEADKLGPLTALVNNAGIIDLPSRVDQLEVARLTRMMATNILGTIVPSREAVRRMSTRHGGAGGGIVNLSSAAAVLGAPGQYVDYAASKGAIDSFTIGLAREVADEGVRVNAVRPGIIDTEIHASGGIPDRAAQMRPQLPMKREGTATEVAEAVLWLLSSQASYVTGTILTVAGGRV